MRTFPRTCALVAVAAGVTALACSDPEFNTDLDTEGPPEVTIVTVLSESLGEAPTFCNTSSEVKVNATLCPEDDAGDREVAPVMDALPGNTDGTTGWFVRVVFSELLDPDIEELEEVEVDEDGDGTPDKTIFVGHIMGTSPVELTCGGASIAYDGFYDPSGNDVTFPPGPALVVNPLDFVASGTTDCEVTLNTNVTDKQGNSVDGSLIGPYDFGIAVMGAIGSDPADAAEGVDPTFLDAEGMIQGPSVEFNAPVDPATVAGQITFEQDGAGPVAFTAEVAGSIVQLTLGAALAEDTAYTITIPAANTITDIEGGELQLAEDFTFTFTTGAAPSM